MRLHVPTLRMARAMKAIEAIKAIKAMKTMMATLAATAVLALAATPAVAADQLTSGTFSPPRVAPELALSATDGAPFKLAKYRGKVVVLEFGYTHCVDVCPVSLAVLAQARKRLGAAGADLQVVFVTVDPERDNVAHLRTYLAQFDPSFIGLSGTPAQVAAVLTAYGITATRKAVDGAPGEYTMHHSSYLYFIDPQGMQRALMPFGRPAADVVHDVALLRKK
jgi:protein SCO1/2